MKLNLSHCLALACGLFILALAPACSKQTQQFDRTVDVQAMIQQLQASDHQSRVDACVALGSAGPHAAKAVPALTQALSDQNSLVRSLAAYALGQIGPAASSALPELQKLMAAGDPEASPSALNAIRLIDASQVPDFEMPNVTVAPQ